MRVFVLALLPLVLFSGSAEAAEPPERTRTLETKDGIRFGLWSKKLARPAPTMIVFDPGTPERLGDPYYQRRYQILVDSGYLCVSVDFPCQGRDERPGEPKSLDCWRHRVEHGQVAFNADLNARTSKVLDHLIEQGYTDAGRIVVGGSSSGGFLALHYAAYDPRIRGGAVVAPVTDLAVLQEFQGMQKHPAVRALALTGQAGKLADRSIWVLMGDRDARVGTESAIQFARAVWRVSGERGSRTGVELHVVPEPGGHAHPPGSHEQAADWVLELNR